MDRAVAKDTRLNWRESQISKCVEILPNHCMSCRDNYNLLELRLEDGRELT